MQTIRTRNTFRAVVRSIRPDLDALDRLDDLDALARASMVLADRDRIIATLEADDAPAWVETELRHGGWADLVDALDALDDALSGRAAADLRADAAADLRRASRLAAGRQRYVAAQEARERAAAVLAAVEAGSSVAEAIEAVRAGAPAPAHSGTRKARRKPAVKG